MMQIIAHRGAPLEAPENSLESVELAIAQGADRVEIDVHLSRDGVAFVSHDETTARCGDQALVIAQSSAAALREVRLANGEPLPTLQVVCDALAGRAGIDLEIKSPGARTAEASLAAMQAAGLARDALVTSFEAPSLRAMRRLGYAGTLGLLVGSKSLAPRQRAFETWPLPAMRRCGADALVIHHRLLHPPLRRALRKHSLGLYVWLSMEDDLVDADIRHQNYLRAAAANVDGIICGRIRETQRVLRDA